MFIITKQWLTDNRTPRLSYNHKQLESIGLTYPQPRGWINRLVGKAISEQQKANFEHHAKNSAKRKNLELRALATPKGILAELETEFKDIGEFVHYMAGAIETHSPVLRAQAAEKQVDLLLKELENKDRENSSIRAELERFKLMRRIDDDQSQFAHYAPIETHIPQPRQEHESGIKIAQYVMPNRNMT